MVKLGISPHRQTGSGGFHCDFEHPGWHVPTLNSKSKKELGERWPGLDIRGDGGYAIFCGKNASGEYIWMRETGELDSLDILPKDLRNFLGLLYPPEEKKRRSIADIALEKYLSDASMIGRDNACFKLAKQLHDNDYSQSDAEGYCMEFARRVHTTNQKGDIERFTEEDARAKVTSAYSYTKREPWSSTTNYSPNHQEHSSNGNGNKPQTTTEDLCSFTEDDAGNGDALYALYGQDFLFCPSRGWFGYTGTHWELDPDGASVKRRAVETLRKRRHAAVTLGKEAIIKCTKGDDGRVNGCVSRFRTLVNVSIDEFDKNPDVANCKNGVVNLQTGEIEPHSRAQRFTYCIPVAYNPNAVCQEWHEYLNGVVGGGQEVIDYLQMSLGYSLTGHTREEILFYLFGPTRSGKGTISEIFMSLMPTPLSTGVDFNSFTAKREGDVSNFDLAPLKVSRLIFASESLKSQSLNPAKIKQLTGGDRIRACYKHKDYFEFKPQFKVWMLSNWPVNGDPEDDALWGRVRVIEFPNSFLGKEDKTKKARLRDNDALEGILAWVVEGSKKWYALGSEGLSTPEAVIATTKKQREELDYVQQWIDDSCEEHEGCWTPNEEVSKSYTAWCKGNNVQYPKGPKALAQSLQAKGFVTGVQKKVDGKNKKGVNGLYIYPENTGAFSSNG
jgi:putative DNA primase/helicase